MAQVFPVAKYFNYMCSISNRKEKKEKKKERRNYLASNFNWPVGK